MDISKAVKELQQTVQSIKELKNSDSADGNSTTFGALAVVALAAAGDKDIFSGKFHGRPTVR